RLESQKMSLTNAKAALTFLLSSRRRHTICYRDWSSDVCSSDLRLEWLGKVVVGAHLQADDDSLPKPFEPRELLARLRAILRRGRSEERRVGKQARWRGSSHGRNRQEKREG